MPDFIKDLTIGELASYAVLITAFASTFIEISPIKINPLSALFKWFGKQINGTLEEKLEQQTKTLDTIRDSVDDNEIDRIRWEILSFANSCRYGTHHSLEEFDHIIEIYEKYHQILDRRHLKNGKIDLEYAYIVDIYKNCQKENKFL